jgi:hypothetical protein
LRCLLSVSDLPCYVLDNTQMTEPNKSPERSESCEHGKGENIHPPIYWNPFNKVYQCHKCGIVFVTSGELAEKDHIIAEHEERIAELDKRISVFQFHVKEKTKMVDSLQSTINAQWESHTKSFDKIVQLQFEIQLLRYDHAKRMESYESLYQMAEKMAGALEDCGNVMRITLSGNSIIFDKIDITLAAYKAMKGEK